MNCCFCCPCVNYSAFLETLQPAGSLLLRKNNACFIDKKALLGTGLLGVMLRPNYYRENLVCQEGDASNEQRLVT